MLVYKVTFLNNEVISCGVTDPQKHQSMREDVYYSENNGLLIFALIKANSKSQALVKANALLNEFSSNNSTDSRYGSAINRSEDNTKAYFMRANGPISTPDYIDTTYSHHDRPDHGSEDTTRGINATKRGPL